MPGVSQRASVIVVVLVLAMLGFAPGVAQARTACVSDPPGDGDGTRDPRGDLVEWCVEFEDAVSFRWRMAQPSNPAGDAGWYPSGYLSAEVLGDFADGSGTVNYITVQGDGRGGMTATAGFKGFRSCTGAARFDGTWVIASGFPPACLGDSSIEVQMSAAYNGDDTYDFSEQGRFDRYGTAEHQHLGYQPGDSDVSGTIMASHPRADRVILARNDAFADALTAGTLEGGPIALIPPCGPLPPQVAEQVNRLQPTEIIAIGGTQALCDGIVAEAAQGRPVTRLAGDDRFATAVAVARAAHGSPTRIFLARADVFADALSAGALTHGPVLLVPACGPVPASVRDYLAEHRGVPVVALGGEAAVCSATHQEAAAVTGGPADRLAGVDRFGTAAAIARFAFPEGADTIYLVDANRTADAVAGGVLGNGPVLPVAGGCVPASSAITGLAWDFSPAQVIALGGPDAVCEFTLHTVANAALHGPTRPPSCTTC